MRKFLVPLVALGLAATASAGAKPPFQLPPHARTQDIQLRKKPMAGIQWDRIQRGLAFYDRHQQTIQTVLATTSLVETYAGIDIAPVTVHTGKLVSKYNQRIMETGFAIAVMLQSAKDLDAFLKSGYAEAEKLNELHYDIAQSVKPADLGWDPHQRHVMNQEAVALVLYAFAWQPLESMLGTKELDAVKDRQGMEDWLYLWRVYGYALGVEEPLLPGNEGSKPGFDRSKAIALALRSAQYPAEGQPAAQGSEILVKGEVKFVMRLGGLTAEQAGQKLAKAIALSPGLTEALRLGPDPAKHLTQLATN